MGPRIIPFGVQIGLEGVEISPKGGEAQTLAGHSITSVDSVPLETLAKTPIVFSKLKEELSFYNHIDRVEILLGFSSGFSLFYSGPRLPTEANNLKSVIGKELILNKK